MPKKITKISFYNYKAFYSTTEDAYTIDLSDGKNLLIYGENGSGKSSIFDGLKDFFLSSIDEIDFNQNVISKGAIPKEPYIEVEFTDENQPFYFSMEDNKSNTKTQPFIRDANQVKSFLSYKNLLALHYFRLKEEVNIFDILFSTNGILYDYKNPVGKSANGTDIPLGLLYANISKYATERRNSYNYNRLLKNPGILSDFNDGVKKTLQLIIKNTNKFLNIFNQKFYLRKFEYTPLELKDVQFIPDRLIGGKLNLNLYFYKIKIPDYNLFLNEARLTALSISIYFSAIKTIPPPAYQIIFLDDIFIGLDTSNRIPLLSIIKNEFISNFQIIITTYDRYWFEIAKDQLGADNWETAEMYLKNNTTSFQPVIIQPSKDYYDLAKKHYYANDYPACGNYQRKACEECIKQFIPRKMQLQENADGTISEVNDLETLFNALKKYLDANSLDISPFRYFGLYKRLVLNKLSHDDLKSPYYKSELEEMFSILVELRKLKREIIINTDEFIYFETNDSSGQSLKFDVKVLDNLVLLRQGTTKKYQKCIFSTVNKHINGLRKDFSSDVGDLKDVYKNICYHLSITPNNDSYSQFKDKNGKLLSSF